MTEADELGGRFRTEGSVCETDKREEEENEVDDLGRKVMCAAQKEEGNEKEEIGICVKGEK